jgi:hypothetical protein
MTTSECIICAYTIDHKERLPTITLCSHNEHICSICFLRVRSLQRNFHCPTCKRELDRVIVTNDTTLDYQDYTMWGDSIGEGYQYDELSQMFFPKDYYRLIVEKLRQLKCQLCNHTRRDFYNLKKHYQLDHNLHLCSLCIENKQVFPSEQRVYTKQDYDRHLRHGDNDGSIGHPNCEFCHKRFYDSTLLFLHLNKEHYTCFLCDQQGIKFKYFADYTRLEQHFSNEHFLCKEKSCLERRFVAFHNEIDYNAHILSYHPHLTVSRTITLDFKIRRTNDTTNNTNSNSGDKNKNNNRNNNDNADIRTSRYEGGLGGTASDGMWQLELAPTTRDPRDPNRNLDDNSNTNNTSISTSSNSANVEDFPALLPSNPTGSSIVTNRWITTSVKSTNKKSTTTSGTNSTSTSSGGYSSKVSAVRDSEADFPSLPINTSIKKYSNSSNSNTTNTSKKYAQATEIEKEYATLGASTTSTSSKGPSNNEFADWAVNIKVDKRLKKSSNSSNNTTTSTSTSTSVVSNSTTTSTTTSAYGNNWDSSGITMIGPSDYESDLRIALQESLAMSSSSSTSMKYTNSMKPVKLDDEEAFPTLMTSRSENNVSVSEKVNTISTSSSNNKTGNNGSTKKKGPVISNDWSDALKSVGIAVSNKKKKSKSGLTVIKADSKDADLKLKPSPGSGKK